MLTARTFKCIGCTFLVCIFFSRPPFVVAQDLKQLSRQYDALSKAGRHREAEAVARRALEAATAAQQPIRIGFWCNQLGVALMYQGRDTEAEPLHKRALAIRERALGPDHPQFAQSLNALAYLYGRQGRYAEAELLHKRALAIEEKTLGADHTDVATSLNNLAILYMYQGRYAEAEPLHKRALAINEKALGADNSSVAGSLNNLAELYRRQGRYAEAEPLHKRALAIDKKAFGADHPDAATILANLANLYRDQGRYAEAEPMIERALVITEKAFGPEYPGVATSLNNLGNLYADQGRYAEAEPPLKRALAIYKKALGPDHPDVAMSLNNLGNLYRDQGRYAEAEPPLKRALAISEKAKGPDDPDVATSLNDLAALYLDQGGYFNAEPLLDRAIAIRDRAGVAPGKRFEPYSTRSDVAWKMGRHGAAIADLNKALDLAEQQRGHASGAERERAGVFTTFARAFERMVAWQTELGDPGQALWAMERSHARSLLDELRTAGADLDAGRSAAEKDELRARQTELKGRAAGLERQLSHVYPKTLPDEARRLEADLAKARYALYDFERDARNSSPIYRDLITRQAEPPKLELVRERVLKPGDLLLVYLLGEEAGYVAAVTRESARMVRLELGAGEASALDVKPGPLTAQRLFDALIKGKEAGVMGQLSDPKAEVPTARLAALWRALVPEPERQALVSGKVKRLIVVPDGPLALLPFEALVVGHGTDPEYLLDAGPPIAYAPSAAVLLNLIDRPVVPSPPDREPVLTLGDPAYPDGDSGLEEATRTGLLTTRSRYGIAGGRLPRLPHSATEAQWVANSFREAGIKAGVLSGANATERAVRYWAPGRKVLHLACHGLADASYGNYFGALALTPVPKARTEDDGFLTLAEVCELNLKGCELAILSACQTNYGPQQKGEGTWALSRGFLVAGARRVVASNWLVDDEAAASLVSVLCSGLAQSEKAGKVVDYARSLQESKRWVRKQGKWKSPYYWASLVLVGPP
jgi:CHAT domain-containing protein/tetratricopeptide (TPR) repeat protein